MCTDNNGIITLQNSVAECKISLFGGNILSYRPKTQKHNVFWLGDLNKFDNVQAIRGGIPICWPRFAQEQLNSHLPRHGFARTSLWTLENVYVDETKMTAHLCLIPDKQYNLNICADLFIKITDKLECILETTNLGTENFAFSEAFHAYFYVGSRDKTQIKGVQGFQYINSLDGKNYKLDKDLTITEEFDSVFMNHTNSVKIVDNKLKRIINLEKKNSNSTVVWNPNKNVKEASSGQFNKFICVEPANMGDNFVTLSPQEKHSISMIISVKNME